MPWSRRRRAPESISTDPEARLPIATGIDPWRPPEAFLPGLSVLLTVPIADFRLRRHELLIERARAAGADETVVAVYDANAGPMSTYEVITSSGSFRAASSAVWSTWGGALAVGLPLLTRRVSAVIDTTIDITAASIAELAAGVTGDIAVVQPLILGTDDVVRSAGSALPVPGAPTASVLRGHPREDGLRSGRHTVFAADEPCVAFLTEAAATPVATVDTRTAVTRWSRDSALSAGKRVAVLPLDRVYRTAELRERRYDLDAADALSAWRGASDPDLSGIVTGLGFEVAEVRADPAGQPVALREPVLRLRWAPGVLATREREQRLRWSIKIAAHPGPRGDDWGDLFFARDLADALRALGQDVIIDHREAHQRPLSEHLDDVSLVLRGLDDTPVTYGAVNLLWVISHPDRVSDSELARFDLRYAAGPTWALAAGERSGVPVEPLLQATNPDRFTPDGPTRGGVEVAFVGKTRGVVRPMVHDALAAGLPVRVWGEGWRDLLPPEVFAGEFLDNENLPILYRSAHIVLNDHWADMAAGGFISNRIFDAVAAGAFVITDPVPGLDSVFHGAAVPATGVDQLREAATALARSNDGSLEARRIRALDVGREHSFQARARRLLADVLTFRATQGQGGSRSG